MDKLFLQIINMSITSSYVILFVLGFRFLLKKAPKIFSYGLWSVVFFRLIFPFSFESIFSLISINTKTIPQDIIYTQTPMIQSGITVIDRAVNNTLPAPIVGASVNPMQIWTALGQTIWLLGIGTLLIYSVISTIKLSKRLKSSNHVFHNIYETNNIITPFVFGITNPKIYLPIGLSETEKSYIIKHEETHIKRFDHIIKPLAFLILCIHWFNPLVWLAFFLMSKDMELSCDEKVIRSMGNGVKKDYSNSLLSLSTGRRIINGAPLAFGENNTKGRIKNILNYRKPGFWVTLIGIIIIVVASIGLLSNPKISESNTPEVSDNLTVEDYAREFVDEVINMYENSEWGGFKVLDSKITKLERINTFTNILKYPVELWSLEFRIKPEDISKVIMAGGMSEIDGWITEETSMGKPFLVFSVDGDNRIYLGSLYPSEAGINTLALQEIAIREMLEGNDTLPKETYKGNHIVIKFPNSRGETYQILLSQPVAQGSKGIWVVERWMDGNGIVYHTTPNTELRIDDYYKELQKKFDNKENLSLGDPIEVGYDYIINNLGQTLVKRYDLIIKDPATVEDFLEVPESHYQGKILYIKLDDFVIQLDRIQLLDSEDVKRMGLEVKLEEMPGGYYLFAPSAFPENLYLDEESQYFLLNWKDASKHNIVSKNEFIQYINGLDYRPLFNVYTKYGYITKIEEVYLP